MMLVKKLLKDIYQLRKMRTRLIMQKVSGVVQDGKSQKSTEIFFPKHSNKKKLKERLLLQQLLPPLKKEEKKVRRVRLKLKVKKRKKRKRKKLKLLLKVTLSQLTLSLSQSLMSKISIVCKIS
jgi:hypothetical protein